MTKGNTRFESLKRRFSNKSRWSNSNVSPTMNDEGLRLHFGPKLQDDVIDDFDDYSYECTEEDDPLECIVVDYSSSSPSPSSSSSSFASEDSDSFWDSDIDTISESNRIVFNVSGQRFVTLKKTLRNAHVRELNLANKTFLDRHWDSNRKEFFFERDAELFKRVLNYMRTGYLHVPVTICSPKITEDLAYWGVELVNLEPCCWINYSIGQDTQANINKLVNERKGLFSMYGKEDPTLLSEKLYIIVTLPDYSRLAKAYFIIFCVTVFIGIIHFFISTMPFYRENPNQEGYAGLHTYFQVVDLLEIIIFSFDVIVNTFCNPVSKASYVCTVEGMIDIVPLVADLLQLISLVSPGAKDVKEKYSGVSLLRTFKVLRLFNHIKALNILQKSFFASAKHLGIMTLLLSIIVMVLGGVIFSIENTYNPHGNFTSVPQSCWWGIITITQVGYGDMVPESTPGKLVASLAAFAGTLVLGLMIPPLAKNFVDFTHYLNITSDDMIKFEVHKMLPFLDTGPDPRSPIDPSILIAAVTKFPGIGKERPQLFHNVDAPHKQFEPFVDEEVSKKPFVMTAFPDIRLRHAHTLTASERESHERKHHTTRDGSLGNNSK